MTIDNLTTTVDGLRNQALTAKAAFNAQRQALSQDDKLSLVGRTEAMNALRQTTNETLLRLSPAETKAIDDAATNLRRKVAGGLTSQEDIIAFRDAQDRADSLSDAREALRIMDRALLTGDHSLASAVMSRASSAGWSEVTARYSAENPSAAADYADYAAVVAFRDGLQQVLLRGATYAAV